MKIKMKQPFLIILFGIFSFTCFAQEGITEISKDEADKIQNKVNKGVDFGVSLGFNTLFHRIYDARISPLDNKLKISEVPNSAFLLSTGISVPISQGHFGGRYYRKLDSNGDEYGPVYYVPFGFCFLATINLVSFNSAATGSSFNQKIDGGLGLAYRINDNFQLALTYEMISQRQPRDFLIKNYKDEELKTSNGTIINSITPDDNDYFYDKYIPSVSFKFFYLISYKPVKP